ncbi:MAG TPA: ATP-binding protein [Ilumatobacteraceae bacterium]|nr:ATP-binding protein [Ilumatobacteraceae bacterium]
MESADGPHQRKRRDFVSTSESIGAARDFVRDVLGEAEVDDATSGDAVLAVSELVTNAVVHGAGGPISVRIETTTDELVVLVRSTGGPLPDPATWTSPVGGGPTGRGLSIVRSLADDVTADVDGTVVTLSCTFRRS